MDTEARLDAMRATVIRRAERTDLFFRCALGAVTIVEAAGIFGMVWFADFKDPTHRLMLVQTVLIYGTLGIGLIALGALVRLNTLRVLVALETGRTDT